jgi:glycosyltransferase involved in cell wall biosynthesis
MDKRLSVILPVRFDDRVFPTINKLENALRYKQINYEVIISGPLLSSVIESPTLRHITTSGGKGENIIRGLEICEGQYVLVMDADCPVTEQGLLELIDCIGLADVVVGHRCYSITKGRICRKLVLRQIRTVTFRLIAQSILPELAGLDSQFGVKLIRRNIATKYASLSSSSSGFAFDLEFLLRMLLDGLRPHTIILDYLHQEGSVINPFLVGIELTIALLRLRSLRSNYLFSLRNPSDKSLERNERVNYS